MARTIKFRAWAKGDRKYQMYDVRSIGKSLRGKPMITLVGWGSFCPNDSLEAIMQYIGLKDENNKEVYEGDVVECKYPGNWEIYWANKADNGGVMACYKARRYDNPVNCTIYTMGAMTIIGNIYENPELLNPKDK